MVKYWINSNSGDYISECDGVFTRKVECNQSCLIKYLPYEKRILSNGEFQLLKGFVPIKAKKLFSRKPKVYAPTEKGGSKGKSERFDYHQYGKSYIRNNQINNLLK